jgi:NitT/TauT family transport system substrate-binding protein
VSPSAAGAPLGTVRGAFEATGSPSWIMRTVLRRGLDERNGFALALDLGGDGMRRSRQASAALLAEGDADVVDTDWLSIARLRRDGVPVTAVFPYGRIMGGVVVSAASAVRDLAGMRGRTIGVVHALDKNWLVVRAACLRRHGFDPAREARVVEATSKTVLLDWLERGAVDVAVLYWHLVPRLVARGRFRELCDVLDLLAELSGSSPPTTFFVFREDFVAARPGVVRAFVEAYREAVALLRASGTLWAEAVAAPDGPDAAPARALRASWERRVCTSWRPGDVLALRRLFDTLRTIAGDDAVGGVRALPPEMFHLGFTNGGGAPWST